MRIKIAVGILSVCAGCGPDRPPQVSNGVPAGVDIHRALENGATDQAFARLVADPALIESLDNYRQTPLHVAAHQGQHDAVTWLLGHGAHVSPVAYNRFTPLHLAADAAVAEALIKAGADLVK